MLAGSVIGANILQSRHTARVAPRTSAATINLGRTATKSLGCLCATQQQQVAKLFSTTDKQKSTCHRLKQRLSCALGPRVFSALMNIPWAWRGISQASSAATQLPLSCRSPLAADQTIAPSAGSLWSALPTPFVRLRPAPGPSRHLVGASLRRAAGGGRRAKWRRRLAREGRAGPRVHCQYGAQTHGDIEPPEAVTGSGGHWALCATQAAQAARACACGRALIVIRNR